MLGQWLADPETDTSYGGGGFLTDMTARLRIVHGMHWRRTMELS